MSSPRAGAAPVRAPTDPPTRQSHCIQAGSCNASRFKYYRVIIQLCDKLNSTHLYVSLYHVCIHFLIYPGTLLISSFEKSPLSHSALVVFIPSPTHFHPTICCSQLHTIAGVRLQKIPTGVPPKIALGVKNPNTALGAKNKSQLLAQLHPAPPHFPWPVLQLALNCRGSGTSTKD